MEEVIHKVCCKWLILRVLSRNCIPWCTGTYQVPTTYLAPTPYSHVECIVEIHLGGEVMGTFKKRLYDIKYCRPMPDVLYLLGFQHALCGLKAHCTLWLF